MAHSSQARKRVRQNKRRAAINRGRLSRIRTFVRHVEEAIASGDKSQAEQALREAQPEIMRGATKALLHRRTAARRVSLACAPRGRTPPRLDRTAATVPLAHRMGALPDS
ncbi:30S ribosomal protein S20 [Geodia barretti]|uniref:30S ribosomal protein S20 n=1 Tax=Geodia barretti TaxID=519541 RepID=A0AA35XM00_GEOBA|nr:30S ribosomal protein S20 [Geodia barretti]